jgi:thiol-disulfide isomerase/thioredoxin
MTAKVMTLNSPSEYEAVDKLIRQGPVTLILVYSPTCPHCHTYMPLWKKLQKMSNKNANMVTMEASTYDETPLSEKKQIEGVPSVLFVDKAGSVSEVSDIRNTTKMSNLIRTGSETGNLDSETLMDLASSASEPTSMSVSASVSEPLPAVIPGQKSYSNPLPAIPGMTSEQLTQKGGRRKHKTRRHGGRNRLHTQRGGNPWAAFLASAGPAAVLAGAYAALPARSSGLLAPRHSAKWRRIHARLTRRRRS